MSTCALTGAESPIWVPRCSLAAVTKAAKDLKKVRSAHLRATIAWAFGLEYEPEPNASAKARMDLPAGYEHFVQAEPETWEAIFPPRFYRAMCHLLGIEHTGRMIVPEGALPAIITWEGVYKRLPDPVSNFLAEVNERIEDMNGVPTGKRRYKHHQFLTQEVGRPALRMRIEILTEQMLGAASISELFATLGRVKGREIEMAIQDKRLAEQRVA